MFLGWAMINGSGSRRICQSPILLLMFGCKKADEIAFKHYYTIRQAGPKLSRIDQPCSRSRVDVI
jgi:hypothetical protein